MGGARKQLSKKELASLTPFQKKIFTFVGAGSIKSGSEKLGVRYSTLQSWMYRGTKPTMDQLRRLITATRLPFEYWADDAVTARPTAPAEPGQSEYDRVHLRLGQQVYSGEVLSLTGDELTLQVPEQEEPLCLPRHAIRRILLADPRPALSPQLKGDEAQQSL